MPTPAPAASARDLRTSLLIGLVCFVVYNANLRSISAGDTYPARYQPFAILWHGSLSLDPILPLVQQKRSPAEAHWIREGRGGRAISLYPVVLPVLVTPLYVPPALFLRSRGWPDDAVDRTARVMEKGVASLIAASSAALLFLLLRRRASTRLAASLALVYAFGTTTWVISSQALWQHGLAQLLLVGALWLVTAPPTVPRVIAAGAVLALAAGNRPPDALLAAAIGFHALFWAGRRVPWLVGAALVPAGLVLAYNLAFAGHWAGGYGLAAGGARFDHGVLAGLAGLLFSPTHGLFVFSPFLLLVPLAFRRLAADAGDRRLTLALGIAMAVQVLFYAQLDWSGGASWGPRWLTDLVPLLFWMLPPAVVALRPAGRAVFTAGCAVAIAIEAVGAFWYMNVSDEAVATAANRQRALWDVRNAPFVAELRHAPAPADLWASTARCDAGTVQGSLDLVGGRSAARDVPTRDELRVEGWALVGGRSPWEVAVTVDGRAAGATSSFFTRPDVVRTIGATSPAGWNIPIRTADLAPGEHLLQVVARACAGGPPLVVADRRIVTSSRRPPAPPVPVVGDPAGPAGARRATALLQHDQQPAGYWLTSYTSVPRFEAPTDEMNTFLTATIVDLLEPVAGQAGTRDALDRARLHLTAQIEGDGLVRYHGLPDGPTIGWLGCVISPDADDTALAWRIAPAGKPDLLRAAIAGLGRYRTSEGLYRTWLSPRGSYQCIDPGRDPNPTDVVIQIHVLQLLARADPPAARALCGAVSRVAHEDRMWVYYRTAPPVPILRQSDLEKAGCPLPLPAPRLRTQVPGQQVWVDAATLLRRFTGRGQPVPARAETEAILRSLAADDFSAVRSNPPLVYHNDQTASTPRFYWSEDFGYALWLRLFHEHALRHPTAGDGGR
ncbi:MAG: hypothetical protein ABW221_24480 [Vicinamibacteria bacterium]